MAYIAVDSRRVKSLGHAWGNRRIKPSWRVWSAKAVLWSTFDRRFRGCSDSGITREIASETKLSGCVSIRW